MVMTKLCTTYLKPSPTTISTARIPLTIFDKVNFDGYVSLMFAFQSPMPSNDEMKRGLGKALAYFPHLAGRFSVDKQGSPSVLLNDAGVRLIDTYVNMKLAERLPLQPSPEISKRLLPAIDGFDEPLQIQLNRFSCRGVVIGANIHHRVADGHSFFDLFMHSWGRLVRGLDVDPLPRHDRAAILAPRKPPRCEFNHQDVEFGAKPPSKNSSCLSSKETLAVHFSADLVTKIKAKGNVGSDLGGHGYSTFVCLLAHLWKKITSARGLQDDEETRLHIAVNGRARVKPDFPMEYFGNLVLWAYPTLRVRDLLHGSNAFVAKAIHEAVDHIDEAYFKSFIDFGELYKAGGGGSEMKTATPDVGEAICPHLEVSSLLKFEFHDLRFGVSGPCQVQVSSLPVEGLVLFMPSLREKGAIEVVLSLFREHAEHFKRICYSLD